MPGITISLLLSLSTSIIVLFGKLPLTGYPLILKATLIMSVLLSIVIFTDVFPVKFTLSTFPLNLVIFNSVMLIKIVLFPVKFFQHIK